MTKPTKWVYAQRRLRSAWASAQSDQSSLCVQWVAKDPSFLHADSGGSDQTGRMPRLIWVFAGCTDHFVGFVIRRLISDHTHICTLTAAEHAYKIIRIWLYNISCTTFESWHDKTSNVVVCPAKTQISLGIRPVWSESSLCAWGNLGSLATHWAHSEDSDQTGQMPRLIWVFPGRTFILLVLSCCGSFC